MSVSHPSSRLAGVHLVCSASIGYRSAMKRYGSAEDGQSLVMNVDGYERRSSSSKRTMAAAIAIAAVAALGALGFASSIHGSLTAQTKAIEALQAQLDSMRAEISVAPVEGMSRRVHRESHQQYKLPSKFAVPLPTPLKTQDNRGTCWDFATVGVLENSYRQQGVANGWLKPDEYMAISEQAYGEEVLRLCTGPPDSPQQKACLVPGNGIWKNSTEGGASTLLFYLQHGFEHNIYPHSICPYFVNDGNDTVCDGLTPEKRASNPLRVTVHRLETLYNDEVAIKEALVRDQQAMALTTSMPYITYYYPCVGDLVKDERCNPASTSCTICPPELSATTCCIPVTDKENYNMHGEYITSHTMTPEGGHVMTLVGYNDGFRTKQGFTGGLILKNSWFDGIRPPLGTVHARGSHSLRYWMQEVSDWEEAVMCPNSHNPENWYQCGNSGEVIHAHAHADSGDVPFPSERSSTPTGGVEECLTDEVVQDAKMSYQPLHLKCTDAKWCTVSDDVTYFTRNSTSWRDRMLRMCFFEYNTVTKASSELCLPPMLGQDLAYVLSPVDEEVLEDDPDVCGFYFYPYEVMRTYARTFGDVSIDNFELEWDPQSYAANSELYPELDYSDVIASTRSQRQYNFEGPFPFARVVSKDELPSTA